MDNNALKNLMDELVKNRISLNNQLNKIENDIRLIQDMCDHKYESYISGWKKCKYCGKYRFLNSW